MVIADEMRLTITSSPFSREANLFVGGDARVGAE
jgi:hypothetical protein